LLIRNGKIFSSVLLGPFRNKVWISAGIILITAVLEGLSFGMLLPLLEVVINGEYGDNGISNLLPEQLLNAEDKGDLALAIACGVCFLFLLKNVFVIIKNRLIYSFEWGVRGLWMKRIFKMYLNIDFRDFTRVKEGEAVNNVTYETLKAASALRQMLELCSQVLISLALVGVLFLSNPNITFMIVFLAGLVLYMTKKAVTEYANNVGRKRMEYDGEASQVLVESLAGMQTVRALELGNKIHLKFSNTIDKLVKLVSTSEVIKRLPFQISEVSFALMFVVIIYYIDRVLKTDVASYLPFLGMLSMVSVKLFSNVGTLASNIMAIKILTPSVELIVNLVEKGRDIQEESPAEESLHAATFERSMSISKLSFAYENERNVFKGIDISIDKNKTIGFVGESGVGKSTFVKLLLGLLTPSAGRISVDGVSFEELELGSWRKQVGYVNQEPYFFNGSIKDNLLMVKPAATDDEVDSALALAHCKDFVDEMPGGVNASLGDKGLTISGGQRARLALARALIIEPSVLVLDEMTGSLDPETEELVIKLIESMKGKMTIIIITHKRNVLRSADRVHSFTRVSGETTLERTAA